MTRLTTRLEACVAIRRVVFIEEQGVPEHEELDGRDAECAHFLCERQGQAVGTARLRMLPDGHAKAERVAVLASWRGRGVGRSLMAVLEAEAARRGASEVRLGAQITAVPFYEGLGYHIFGEPFMDADIPHRWMARPVG